MASTSFHYNNCNSIIGVEGCPCNCDEIRAQLAKPGKAPVAPPYVEKEYQAYGGHTRDCDSVVLDGAPCDCPAGGRKPEPEDGSSAHAGWCDVGVGGPCNCTAPNIDLRGMREAVVAQAEFNEAAEALPAAIFACDPEPGPLEPVPEVRYDDSTLKAPEGVLPLAFIPPAAEPTIKVKLVNDKGVALIVDAVPDGVDLKAFVYDKDNAFAKGGPVSMGCNLAKVGESSSDFCVSKEQAERMGLYAYKTEPKPPVEVTILNTPEQRSQGDEFPQIDENVQVRGYEMISPVNEHLRWVDSRARPELEGIMVYPLVRLELYAATMQALNDHRAFSAGLEVAAGGLRESLRSARESNSKLSARLAEVTAERDKALDYSAGLQDDLRAKHEEVKRLEIVEKNLRENIAQQAASAVALSEDTATIIAELQQRVHAAEEAYGNLKEEMRDGGYPIRLLVEDIVKTLEGQGNLLVDADTFVSLKEYRRRYGYLAHQGMFIEWDDIFTSGDAVRMCRVLRMDLTAGVFSPVCPDDAWFETPHEAIDAAMTVLPPIALARNPSGR